MKVAPIHRAIIGLGHIQSVILHTGQHYDERMSTIFFDQLGMPKPDIYLGIGGGSHAEQTAAVMLAFEKVLIEERPELVLVVGDVNSTVACSLVAAKAHIPVAHVEAGLRSGDRSMPEEINRIVTDSISDYLFVTEQSGLENLRKEGVPDEKVFFVGNVMIDSLVQMREKARLSTIAADLGVEPGGYALMTMHRPSNVDVEGGLQEITRVVESVAVQVPIVFPMHPRTLARFDEFGLRERLDQVADLTITEPLGYLEFLHLMENAAVVITDSGGVQEETTYLRVPCLTMRENTERPITVEIGTNKLVPVDADVISRDVARILAGARTESEIPPLWDGHAAERIAATLATISLAEHAA
jgi:UDP-N-acetylglucosamine 2-epimerase (non-hydrolysing)